VRLVVGRLGVFELLLARGAFSLQRDVAVQVGARELQVGCRELLLRLGLGYQGFLQLPRRFDIDDFRLPGAKIGPRLLSPCLVVAVVDSKENCTPRNAGVVVHRNLDDVARELRRDAGDVATDISVVRRLLEAASREPIPAPANRQQRHGKGNNDDGNLSGAAHLLPLRPRPWPQR
jgi:hypothetical protein